MTNNESIDWSTEESLRKIITDARFGSGAPSDAIARAYGLIVKEKNEQFPHLEWSCYQDTSYKWHIRVRTRGFADKP